MIAAKNYSAVFCVAEPGTYVQCEVIAWSGEGKAMCAARDGDLVVAKDHPMFVGLVTPCPKEEVVTGKHDPRQAWFRRCLGLAADAPIKHWPATDGSPHPRFVLDRPFVPDLEVPS